MKKRYIIISIILILNILPLSAQVKKQESVLKREVTLYNPYKPALPDSKKKSFLPEMNDTTKIRPVFRYDVNANPFFPEYTISPIKAAALLPDPLTKLYKGYVNLGIGNYLTPLAEVSVTNERSKKGAIGIYARHFSTNGNVGLDNGTKGFAGYMDNDASLFGRLFFRKSTLEGSLDYTGRTRYAYGYSPFVAEYFPLKKEIRIPYNNIGGKATYSSVNLDSTELAYNFHLSYDYFTSGNSMSQKSFSLSGVVSKALNQFYAGAGIFYDRHKVPEDLILDPKYVVSVSPFIKQKEESWNFKLGMTALLDRNLTSEAKFHAYPDIDFGLTVVPSYLNFFASLSGKLEENAPLSAIKENPFLMRDGSLYKLPNTSYDMIITTGVKGNNGIGGNYMLSGSYSLISNMLFFTNIVTPDTIIPHNRGNYFKAITDDVELLTIHGEMGGPINNKFSYFASANIYSYKMSNLKYAWNKPKWDGRFELRYNLRDKILAGIELTGQGKRYEIVNGDYIPPVPPKPATPDPRLTIDMPVHFNLNFTAEYRYSKILSFWAKLDNIANNHYYEWTYYPSQGFMFMVGLKYSL